MEYKGLLPLYYSGHTSTICLWHKDDIQPHVSRTLVSYNRRKQQQVDIDNVQENYRRVAHDYTVCNLVYPEMTGIYNKLDYKRQGMYITTEVF